MVWSFTNDVFLPLLGWGLGISGVFLGLFLFIILPVIKLTKSNIKKEKRPNHYILKILGIYIGLLVIQYILLGVSGKIFWYNSYTIGDCGLFCSQEGNNPIQLMMGLLIQLGNITMINYLFVKIIEKLQAYQNKVLKYILIVIHVLVSIITALISLLVYYGLFSYMEIEDIFINVLRYITIGLPIIAFGITIYIKLLLSNKKRA